METSPPQLKNWATVQSERIGKNLGPGNVGDILGFFRNVTSTLPCTDQKVLDVGCNTAWFANYFHNYVGIDSDEAAVKVAREYWLKAGRWSAQDIEQRVQLKKIEDLSISGAQFDGIILRDVLEHLPQPIETLSQVLELLKPGGWIFISTPDSQKWVWNDPTHVRPFPRTTHRWFAARFGLTIIHEAWESVAPGTQVLARRNAGRTPGWVRVFWKLPFWPRNTVSVFKKRGNS